MSQPESKAKFLSSSNDPPSSGYITYRMQEEQPIFTKRKMLLNIPQSYSDITHLTVSHNWLYCLVSQQVLLKYQLPKASPPIEIPLDKYSNGHTITKMFLDHTGQHLLITLASKTPGLSPELIYVNGKTNKVKRIEKLKDHEVTAVGFNVYQGDESSTGPILIGTSRGLIFEIDLNQDGDRSYRKQLPSYIPLYGLRELDGLIYDLGLGRMKYPINGLDFFRVPGSSKYVVLAATPDCLYGFHETIDDKFSLQTIFNAYVNGMRAQLAEEIKTDLKYSVLGFHVESQWPTRYAWLNGNGIRFGELSKDLTQDNFILGKENIPFSQDLKPLSVEERKQLVPKTIMLTQFHALLLYPDHITGVCLLNQEPVYEEYFSDQFGKLLDIVMDPFNGSIYAYTPKQIFHYRVTHEKRNLWQLYLQKGMYDLAEQNAENPAQMDIVLARKAEVSFDQKEYLRSAEIYSNTKINFEQICLKFLSLEDKRPLMTYVKNRLDKLRNEDLTQITMLVVWLVELYLTEISWPGLDEQKKQDWQSEFDSFLQTPRVDKCIRNNRSVIYDLMASHGDSHNLSMLAAVNHDYESVINQHINQQKFPQALSVLRTQRSPEMFYKYAPILMEELPQETVAALMAQGKKLNLERLIPTLICLDSQVHIEEIIKYLEYAVYSLGEQKQALHNYLLRLYAQYKPEKLDKYLENEGTDITLVHYEVKYALRVCLEHEAKNACVFLQCLLEMWEAAVELALTFNIQQAKVTASKPADEETRRKLWLRIAQHDIRGTNDVKKALELLKECELLRIEDLLPFFSDFEKIDDFKEAICTALKNYNEQIQALQADMTESFKQAQRVRSDLQGLRNRSVRIGAQEPCAICESYLLLKPFFVFPCGHKFHGDCLEKQIIPMLTSEQSRRLSSLKQQLENILTTSIAIAERTNQQRLSREKIKTEIENILASDCLYCGVMIDTIDQPFVEDWEQVNVDWE
ncbi:vacuolar protein sorting-associated protein 18 homolog isoform X1 [Eupeodes corollae]|uniref:vacuolar protein sorting-associated protein 18 homolog isoform X1 n=1 Tax=Eupeodes corollae TaxID=290404 RepID=UPI00248FFC62|nr:vacuolar protein sorting-associated protein 18 homolog isoform X1 [Eupeodes corollae]